MKKLFYSILIACMLFALVCAAAGCGGDAGKTPDQTSAPVSDSASDPELPTNGQGKPEAPSTTEGETDPDGGLWSPEVK